VFPQSRKVFFPTERKTEKKLLKKEERLTKKNRNALSTGGGVIREKIVQRTKFGFRGPSVLGGTRRSNLRRARTQRDAGKGWSQKAVKKMKKKNVCQRSRGVLGRRRDQL